MDPTWLSEAVVLAFHGRMLAAREIDEAAFAAWLRDNSARV